MWINEKTQQLIEIWSFECLIIYTTFNVICIGSHCFTDNFTSTHQRMCLVIVFSVTALHHASAIQVKSVVPDVDSDI